jgi:hypothetical protein
VVDAGVEDGFFEGDEGFGRVRGGAVFQGWVGGGVDFDPVLEGGG